MTDSQFEKGYLVVKVSTADEGIPIENALVYVKSYNEEDNSSILYSLRTDKDGETDIISLNAPPQSDSLTPDFPELPYSRYIISVHKEGFNSVENIGLPIFSQITSIQKVNMIPLTEDQILRGERGEFKYFENDGYPSLRSRADL